MISACRERTSVRKGGMVEVCCPELQPDTIVDVIILTEPLPDNQKKAMNEIKKYPVSDFVALLKDGPKISFKEKGGYQRMDTSEGE